MKFIIGKKSDMTQLWQGDKVVAVTKVQAGPCVVVQLKKTDKDGYQAVQLGYGEKKNKNINKPQQGHYKKIKEHNPEVNIDLAFLREFRDENIEVKEGDVIDVSTFETGDKIAVTGISKGRGFQGVVKRYGFHGQTKSHGTKDQVRMPGSAGATGPAHVFKGQRMPGRMGADRVTVTNLEIIEVDQANNILLIKGAIPGAKSGLILIAGEGQLKTRVKKEETKKVKEEKIEKIDTAKVDAPAEENKETKNDKEIKDNPETKEEKKIEEKVEDKKSIEKEKSEK